MINIIPSYSSGLNAFQLSKLEKIYPFIFRLIHKKKQFFLFISTLRAISKKILPSLYYLLILKSYWLL